METTLKAAEVLAAPQTDQDSEGAAAPPAPPAPPAASSSSEGPDPMEGFRRRLDDIISAHGSAAALLEGQSLTEAETTRKEPRDDVPVAMETEVCLIMKGLSQLSSPQQKLDDVVRKYAELAVQRRGDERKLCVLQQRLTLLQDERRSSLEARGQLEALCRELQGHYRQLTEQMVQRCREDEEKRKEMTSHFQTVLTEIQAQIEQHSSRNDKLCLENSNLTAKLEGLMSQCEMREESLEKLNKHRDLQHKLTEAKLQQANALLAEAEDKHKREKEYLLVQAAEWKLQAKTLTEQGAVMQTQLTLYGQKFDEFQTTLAKSNEIYVRFKKEMDNMSDKMKKMEKESNLWRTRFENCNKALTTMIEERAEKSHEYNVFVLKIQKLEKLCRALQDERAILYEKIRDVRKANSSIPAKVFGSSTVEEAPGSEAPESEAAPLLSPEELQELQELQMEDPVLTANMSRLKDEQAKLQEFADSLLAIPEDREEESEDLDPEEDLVSSAMVQFKTQVKEEPTSVPEEAVSTPKEAADSAQPQPDKVEEVPDPAVYRPVEDAPQTTPTKPEEAQTQIQDKQMQPVKPDEIQPKPAEPEPRAEPEEVQISPATEPKPEAERVPLEAEKVQISPVSEPKPEAAAVQVKAEVPVGAEKVQAEPAAAPATESPPQTSSSNGESSKKQTPKKKKKRNGKNAS